MNTIDENSEQLAEGTLLSHLIELRSRLVKIFGSWFVVFICLVPFANKLFEVVSAPMVAELNAPPIATGPASPLLTPFILTAYISLFIAMPIVLYQIWAFIAPGLYRKEKRFAIPQIGRAHV